MNVNPSPRGFPPPSAGDGRGGLARTRPLVSVVVPTYHRPAYLRRCLSALLAQDLDPADYEIIVADNAGCEDTRRLVEALAVSRRGRRRLPAVRYLAAGGVRGPAAARNRGWQAARAAVIAFTDDDCIPMPDWLRRGLARMAEGYLAVAGRVDVPLPPQPTDYERNAAGMAGIQFLTANCFYRQELLAALGGFDEQFAEAWREDSELFFRLLAQGGGQDSYAHAPDAVVVHPVRPARWGTSIQQQRKSLYNALLYKKYPALYRALIQPQPPWAYYRIVAALWLAIVGLLTGRWRLAGAAGLVWALLTGRFCAQRLRGASHAPAHVAEMVVTSAVIPPLAIFWRLYGAFKYRVWFL